MGKEKGERRERVLEERRGNVDGDAPVLFSGCSGQERLSGRELV